MECIITITQDMNWKPPVPEGAEMPVAPSGALNDTSELKKVLARIDAIKGQIDEAKNKRVAAQTEVSSAHSEIEGLRATISSYETGAMTMADQTIIEAVDDTLTAEADDGNVTVILPVSKLADEKTALDKMKEKLVKKEPVGDDIVNEEFNMDQVMDKLPEVDESELSSIQNQS